MGNSGTITAMPVATCRFAFLRQYRPRLAQYSQAVTLAPYFFGSVHAALIGTEVVTLLALLVFGYSKSDFTTARPYHRSAWQTVTVGELAATVALVIAKAIG